MHGARLLMLASLVTLLGSARGLAASRVVRRGVRHHPQRARLLNAWAGEDLLKQRGLFRRSAIPSGVSPWQFYSGVTFLLISQFGVVGFVIVSRLSPDSVPPVNAFTDIANVAMQEAVASGEVAPMMATFWAQAFWADLIGQFIQSGVAAPVFVQQWCESDAARTLWCTSAKAVAESRAASGL